MPLQYAGISTLTIFFAVILLWSLVKGMRVGFRIQLGLVILQVGFLASAAVSLWLAWRWMNLVANRLAGWHPSGAEPSWVVQAVTWWQGAPQIGRIVIFLVFYFVVSGLLHALIRPIAVVLSRTVPGVFASNRLLGGALGLVAGGIRSLFLGAVIFGALHYFAFPWLNQLTNQSSPYQYVANRVYTPYLAPVLDKELPVLGKDANQIVAQNISLFVIPSPSTSERGVVIVPKQISDLANQITSNAKTDKEKADALYEWEIHHIKYDWKKYQDYVSYGKWDAQSPLQTLQTGEGVCADYALLYAEMAHSVGLAVKIDEGIGGTPTDQGSHAWNEVWDGAATRWIPVDTTWGAGQDKWFDAPGFANTHQLQKSILITGTTKEAQAS
jgi:Transglutaminase-like superfamily/Colicin V production protein